VVNPVSIVESLKNRKTIFLPEPIVKRLGLKGFLRPLILEYDHELERLREEKKREWLARGYPEKLVTMALELAQN
jgi:hypothetical protein